MHTSLIIVIVHLTIGKQPCLWCLVAIDDLEGNCSLRGPFPARTVESMCDDYKRFIASGGNIKKVKYFNNCKGEPLFPIPLNQVNNQNFMFSHLICACANKGAFQHHTYQWASSKNSTRY